MAKTTVAFTLDTDKDRDIVQWLDSLPKGRKSEAIREALRVYLGRSGVTLGDIYEAIQELKRCGSVVTTMNVSAPLPDEPPDVAAALDRLGL